MKNKTDENKIHCCPCRQTNAANTTGGTSAMSQFSVIKNRK